MVSGACVKYEQWMRFTYAAALVTMPSSVATAVKSGLFRVSTVTSKRKESHYMYPAIVRVADTRDKKLDLVGGIGLGRHVECSDEGRALMGVNQYCCDGAQVRRLMGRTGEMWGLKKARTKRGGRNMMQRKMRVYDHGARRVSDMMLGEVMDPVGVNKSERCVSRGWEKGGEHVLQLQVGQETDKHSWEGVTRLGLSLHQG